MNKLPHFLCLLLLAACTTEAPKKPEKYDGPLSISQNTESLYSDSGLVKVKVNAVLQEEFANGDRFFPKGIFITFYEKFGQVSATLTSKNAKMNGKTKIYTAEGKVEIKGTGETQKMNTEKLHWDPEHQRVYTDVFVRIETKTEILTGTGLEATQDFKKYKILHPEGIFGLGSQH